MANPVFKCSCEILAHFQCGACEKWWSIGDAEVRNYWFCPWCGVRNAAAADSQDSPDSPDCDEDGVPYWDVPKCVLPEWVKYIAMDGPMFDSDWFGYRFRPCAHLDNRFIAECGPCVRISTWFKKVKKLVLPDIANNQWRNSLRRVRLVECPSPVDGNQSS